MNAATPQAVLDAFQAAQLKEPPYNAAVKSHIESVSKLINQAGDAVCGISQLMQEDQLRKESGSGDDFLNEFRTGCLLSALQLISYSLWERGEELEKVAASKSLDGRVE